jgi:hypothetical protein
MVMIKEQDEVETTATAAVAAIVEKAEPLSDGGRYRPAWKKGNENQVNLKYQPMHGLKYGVKIHERDLVTGQVSKVICRFCLKNKVTHFPYPQIFDTSFRSDKYSNHNKRMHGPEWESYEKLVDEDAIANYWKLSTTEEEATQAPDIQQTFFHTDNVLNAVEMELIWLGEESMYCLVCPEFQFDFIYEYASPTLKVELRKLSRDDQSETQKLNQIVRMDNSRVSRHFDFTRKDIRMNYF